MDWKGEAVMNKRKKLPIGIESFEEMRKEDFYYVDKTRWIEQLLAQWGKVNLFTRPRRFGKSLNMSMLQTFFEVGADASLFDGLYISKNKEVCKQYLGKFPVVSISLKGVNGNTFDEARSCLVKVINREARRLQNLSESEKLTQVDKELFEKLLSQMKDDGTLSSSLLELSELLEKHYEEKVIVLIDEYDVPLAKANENGYYDEMVLLIRNLFENVLKTNHSLKFAVLTGCLRVAKESIFTGLNNFKVYSITDVDFDENFGFTDDEVKELLHYYGQDTHYETVKEWYDGYRFVNESPSKTKWMDWGKDHYATVTWSDAPDNRRIAIAWMSNWQYANDVPTSQYRSPNSVPRDLSLFTVDGETYLQSAPSPELLKLRDVSKKRSFKVNGTRIIKDMIAGNEGAYEIELTIENQHADVIGFRLYNDKGEEVDMQYDMKEKIFSMDRRKSGDVGFNENFPMLTWTAIESGKDELKLRLFVDKSSVEAFGDGGRFVMTNQVFPSEPYTHIDFYSKGGAYKVDSFVIYKLKK